MMKIESQIAMEQTLKVQAYELFAKKPDTNSLLVFLCYQLWERFSEGFDSFVMSHTSFEKSQHTYINVITNENERIFTHTPTSIFSATTAALYKSISTLRISFRCSRSTTPRTTRNKYVHTNSGPSLSSSRYYANLPTTLNLK